MERRKWPYTITGGGDTLFCHICHCTIVARSAATHDVANIVVLHEKQSGHQRDDRG